MPTGLWSRRSIAAVVGLGLVVAACGGGAAEKSTPAATPVPTRQATATAVQTQPVQPTATPVRTVATATPAPPGLPTPTPRPTATAQATPSPTSTRPPAATPAPEGKYGGIIKKALPQDAATWDTLREVALTAQDPLQTVHDQMVTLNPFKESEVIPQLAESWTISSDSTAYTFRIRKGVVFSNGSTLNAHDIKFSYEAILSPPKGITSPIRSSLADIKTMTIPDDYTLVLTLAAPNASILASLGQGRASIIDKELIEKEGRDRLAKWPPVGTGPFMAKEDGWVRGVSTKMVRRTDYWVKGRPFLDAAQFYAIPDAGTQFAAFLTGQVNFDQALLTDDQEKEARTRLGNKLATQVVPTTRWWSIEINTLRPPFTDIRVRQAVALGVDRYGYIKVVQGGRAQVGGNIAPGTGWELPTEELLKFEGYGTDRKANIARAKRLLAEAGFPNGLKTTFFTRNRQVYIENTVFSKAILEEVGITGEVEMVDDASFFGYLTDSAKWVLSVQGHVTPLTDPNSAYQTFHVCGGARNYTGMCDKKVTELYNAQNLATDPAKRKALVLELERYTLGLYHNPIYAYTLDTIGYNSGIKNYIFHASPTSNRQLRDVWME